ncbi:heterokaryon incompatibility protein-domain-containing protein [Paraphoma chrysanthemicola]|uniref:Heterokaryon incompatibility protein-domain-containing protein n=1 Tax=Paraphoma chrysanthemicola TaxID=798071 RepID=A0A8K0RFZ3_9PLEO|nr:heterokaryon incompatibility protein-domain-containing protein [Paraphoma chrysanthemicola]
MRCFVKPGMLCDICQGILKGPLNSYNYGEHHKSWESVRQSAIQKCQICALLYTDGDPIRSTQYTLAFTKYEPGKGKWDLDIRTYPSRNDYATGDYRFSLDPSEELRTSFASYQETVRTGSKQSLNLARTWLDDCRRTHAACESNRIPDWVPSRLIDLGELPDTVARVTEFNGERRDLEYCTLSHCWGGIDMFRLLRSNHSALKTGFEVSGLPRTFRETIEVVKFLGFRYLWIDCLCIMQDSPEDWKYEAERMRDVYRHSGLNIAATGANDSSGGLFFLRDAELIKPSVITCTRKLEIYKRKTLLSGLFPNEPNRNLETKTYSVVHLRPTVRAQEIERSRLNHRAWVLQERMLAPRVLHFARNQILWECRTKEKCETYPHGLQHRKYADEPNTKAVLMEEGKSRPLYGKSYEDKAEYTIFEHWCWLVGTFSRCGLTVLTDKLLSISGIVLEIQRLLNGDTYLAGLWKSTLLEELLWETKDPDSFRPEELKNIPSWSWASVQGSIAYDEVGSIRWEEISLPTAEIIDVEVNGPGVVYGNITSGHVTIKGPLFVALVSPQHSGVASATHLHPWCERQTVSQTVPTTREENGRITVNFDDDESIMPSLPKWFTMLVMYAYDEISRNVRSWPTTLGLVLDIDSDGRYHRVGRFELSGFHELDIPIGRQLDTFAKETLTMY